MNKDYNDTRSLLSKMRNRNYVQVDNSQSKPKKNPTMRDMLKITRSLNEEDLKSEKNRETVYDQEKEEEQFKKFFNDLNVNIEFIDLEVYDDLIFWGGTIDGIIQFVYKVTPEEKTSGIEFNYLDDFSVDNPDNNEIVERIEKYYDKFYKYWRNNILDT